MKAENFALNGKGSVFLPKNAPRADRIFAIGIIVLATLGTLMVFSAGSAYAEFRYADKFFFVKRQSVWLVIGIAVMIISSKINPLIYKKLSPFIYALTLILLVLVLAIGFVGNGAQRWISIGPLTIQPSEIAKMSIVMMLSYYFSNLPGKAYSEKRSTSFIYGTLIPTVIMAVPILLVMLQKHLSCIIILGTIGLLVIIASGVDLRYIGGFTLLGGLSVSYIAFFTDYTKERITVWQDPEAYRLTGGWQTLQGLMAIGSGGLFGLGYGKSVLKYCYVSEPANDMIFAILCEELGFAGAIITIALFAFVIGRGYIIARRVTDRFERLTIFGICTKIAVQLLLNVAVVTNTIPNTGISLPFFSYGGSSLIMLFFEVGMILSFSRYAVIKK